MRKRVFLPPRGFLASDGAVSTPPVVLAPPTSLESYSGEICEPRRSMERDIRMTTVLGPWPWFENRSSGVAPYPEPCCSPRSLRWCPGLVSSVPALLWCLYLNHVLTSQDEGQWPLGKVLSVAIVEPCPRRSSLAQHLDLTTSRKQVSFQRNWLTP